MRRGWWALLFLLLGLPILFAVVGLTYVSSLLPMAQAPRVTGPHDIVGVDSRGSIAWVVPVGDAVVVVDAGMDPAAEALRKEIAGRPILGVLLTHGHADHTAGLAAFPQAPVWIAAADRPLLEGESEEKAALALAYRKVAGTPKDHGELHDVIDGEEITFDGAVFLPVAVPGVTPGSVAFLYRDVLFTGDAVWGGPGLKLPPDALAEDSAALEDSARKLLPLGFETLADGQLGVVTPARAALHRLVGAELASPQVSAAESRKPATAVTGWLERAPYPDIHGRRTVWVVPPGRDPVEVPLSADSLGALVGQWVTATDGGSGHAVVAAEGAPKVEAPRSASTLEPWLNRYVEVDGVVVGFRSLADGATHGRGTFQIADGDAVELFAPVSAFPAVATTSRGVSVHLTAKVVRTDDGKAGLLVVTAPPPTVP